MNKDFFNSKYFNDQTYKFLKKLLGSDGEISAIVSFRTEDGDSGAAIPRSSYNEFRNLINKDIIQFKESPIIRNNAVSYKGRGGNEVWRGNIYISIKGGDQTSIESHNKIPEQKLFNPAIEYANKTVCLDLDITMSYFCLHCYDLKNYFTQDKITKLKNECEMYLKTREYDNENLYNYCINHPSLKYGNGYLIDAIQLNNMSIENFKTSGEENSSVICHNEAANKDIFYFDKTNKFILSPSRPTNLFWSSHLSNMRQQNENLEEYFKNEANRAEKRKALFLKYND